MTWCGVSVGEVQGGGMWFEEVPALRVGTRHGDIIKPLIFLGFEEVVGGGVAEGVGVGGTEGLRGVGVGGTEGLRGVGMLDAELHSSAQSATELVCIFFCFLASLALFFFSAFFFAFFSLLASSSLAVIVWMSVAAENLAGVAVAGIGGGASPVGREGGEVLLVS